MKNDNIAINENASKSLSTNFFSGFERALENYNLPTENIIAEEQERKRIMTALPELLDSIPDNYKKDARYLSKFIAGCSVGLFDASLNYVWNEVVINLRKKVVCYGLDYFFDIAISSKYRDDYTKEEDLKRVKDSLLVNTCKKLELFSDILYRKLTNILDMRNQIGASHPTEYAINSYELLGWLQTCLNDVLMDDISESALQLKQLVDNIKKSKEIFKEESLRICENQIKKLSPNTVSNLLNTLFGLFVSSEIKDQIILKNIINLSKVVWEYSTEEAKYKLGGKIDLYRINLDTTKINDSETFFTQLNGEKYYSKDMKNIQLSEYCDELNDVHDSWDNYMYETHVAKKISSLFDNINEIPKMRIDSVIKVFLTCRIGNGYNYCEGVSPGAKKYYNKLFKGMDESNVLKVIKIIEESQIKFLQNTNKIKNAKEIFKLMNQTILSERCSELLNYLIDFDKTTYSNIFKTPKYKELKNGLF